jgi:hypothetical protein
MQQAMEDAKVTFTLFETNVEILTNKQHNVNLAASGYKSFTYFDLTDHTQLFENVHFDVD